MSGLGFDRARARRIVWLAGPIVIAMLTQTSINVVDTIFISKLDPSRSIPGQAALGYSLPLLWAFGGSLASLGVGVQVMVARRFGAGQLRQAGQVLLNAVLLGLVSAVAMSIFAWFAIPSAFDFLNSNAAVTEVGVPYARWRILGITSLVVTTIYKGFFDGLSQTRVHMYAAVIMNAVNIPFNHLLIYGAAGVPAMHVEGAGLASLISTYIGFAIIAAWTLLPRYRDFALYALNQINPKTMWALIKLSVPTGLAQIFIMSGVLLFLKIIGMLDEAAVRDAFAGARYDDASLFGPAIRLQEGLGQVGALEQGAPLRDWGKALMSSRPPVFTAAAKLIIDLLSVGFVTTIAFGTATATLVSESMGQRDYQKASDLAWDSVKLGMYFYGALGMMVCAAPHLFLDLLSDDAVVIQTAAPGLRIAASLQMFIAMALVLTQALFGAGATRFVMVVELALHGLCLAPLAYLFAVAWGMGFMGVWYAAAVYVVLLGTIMAVKFWRGGWTRIQV